MKKTNLNRLPSSNKFPIFYPIFFIQEVRLLHEEHLKEAASS